MRRGLLKAGVIAVAAMVGAMPAAQCATLLGGGDPVSQFSLAQRYENAEGVPRDYGRALQLYCEAARLGHAEAAFSIGWMYLNGRGVGRDDGVGIAWLRIAAARGDGQATRVLTRLTEITPSRATGCAGRGRPLGTVRPPKEVTTIVARIAAEYGVDAKLVLAVIATESAFQADAVSPRNAQGLMQLMPDTAERFGVKHVFDPAENIRGGTRYLKWLLAYFDGDLSLALAAYNAGEAAVEQYGGIPPFAETRDFVERVRSIY